MKGMPERAISKSRNGDLRLHPTVWDRFTNYGLCILFVYLGIGLFIRGISLVREGGEGGFGGVFLLFFGLLMVGGSIGIMINRMRLVGPIHIGREKREINFSVTEEAKCDKPENTERSGRCLIPFEEVDTVVVRAESASPYAVSFVRLALENSKGMEIILNKGMPFWKAKRLAEHTSGILGCKARVVSPSELELTPLQPDLPWDPKALSVPPLLKVFRICAFLFMVVGLVGFLGSFFIATWGGNMFMKTELPLGSPSGIVVDSTGSIYVGSRSYRRIQRYSAIGEFDRAWHVHGGKGDWCMSIDEQERLRLIVGDQFFYQMNDNDRLFAVRKFTTPRPAGHLRQQAAGPGKSSYYLHRFPVRVTRLDPVGQEFTVFRQGFFMTLITGPLPAWVIFALGLVMCIAGESAKRRIRGKNGRGISKGQTAILGK